MVIIIVILGLIIAAIAIAYDKAPASTKVVSCIIGGAILGAIPLSGFVAIASIFGGGTVRPVWEDMIIAGFIGAIIGAIIGVISGLVVFVIAMLIRYKFYSHSQTE
jgi:hypothetical protein